MHELIEDYLETWQIVRGRIRRQTRQRSFLFKRLADFEEWLNSVTYHGIADALKSLDKWDRKYPFHQFVYLRTRTLARKDLQAESRLYQAERASMVGEEPPLDYEVDPHDHFGEVLEKENIDSLLSQLTDDQVEAVGLRYEANLSVTEIARIMERNPGAVSAILHRGLAKLEKLLVEQSGEKQLARSKLEHREHVEAPSQDNVIPFRLRRSM